MSIRLFAYIISVILPFCKFTWVRVHYFSIRVCVLLLYLALSLVFHLNLFVCVCFCNHFSIHVSLFLFYSAVRRFRLQARLLNCCLIINSVTETSAATWQPWSTCSHLYQALRTIWRSTTCAVCNLMFTYSNWDY